MIRVVLAVVLTGALLAVAMPVVEDAAVERTARTVEGDLRSLGHAADMLADGESAVAPGERGAGRTVTVELPRTSWASAGVDYVAIGALPAADRGDAAPRDGPRSDVLAVRVTGGGLRTVRLATDLRVGSADAPDDRALLLRSSGTHRLRLRFVRTENGTTVVVARPRDRRGFMPERAAMAGHATGPRPVPRAGGRLPV